MSTNNIEAVLLQEQMYITAAPEDFLESLSMLQTSAWCADDLQHFTRRNVHFYGVMWFAGDDTGQ